MTADPSRIVIVGASESDQIGHLPEISALQLHAEAARNAVRDAGINRDDIDGFAAMGQWGGAVSHYLGITPEYLDATDVGGCSFMLHVRHASAAIAAGLCRVVLITHGQSGRSRLGEGMPALEAQWLISQFEAPYGTAGPVTRFPIGLLRYMKEYGLTHEQLASVAVAQRKWAAENPRAFMRDPITVDDVLDSPLVCYPMHRLECCLNTGGGGAIVMTSEEHADRLELTGKRVHVLGSGESSESLLPFLMEDLTSSKAFRVSGRRAFESAGITHADVDHLMIYDAFAHLPIYGLEDLGFVGRGEAGAFIADGNTEPGGQLPMNTNGGGLSYTHTGMYGMFALQESIRQVRGEAAAQVPNVEVSVAHGVGSMFTVAGTIVLGTRDAADEQRGA
jgi:acetyl-CoA acetyltransferase